MNAFGGGKNHHLKAPKMMYLRRYRAKLYIKDFKVLFFYGPSSAVNFECQLLSVEPDHDNEKDKLC